MDAVFALVDIETFHQLVGQEQGDITWWQMTVRGVLVFLYGLVLVRLAGQRVFAKLTGFDILIAILVGPNLSRTLTANTPFIPTLVATSSIVFLYWIITYLAFHSKFVGWLVKGDLVQLMRDGQVDWKAMSRHGLSEGDIEEAARRKGVHRLDEVEAAFLERGATSVFSAGGKMQVLVGLCCGRAPAPCRPGDRGRSRRVPGEPCRSGR